MGKKLFIDPITVRNNGIRIAYKMWQEGFIPSIIYVPLRGGAGLGNIISEVFKLLAPETPVMYCAVVAHSYSGFTDSVQINIDGWTLKPEHIRPVDRVLLVDDIFDSGHSANFLWNKVLEFNMHPENFRLAVHDYKEFLYRKRPLKTPDYFANHYQIKSEEDDFWIHYSSHELYGLSLEEREEHYYKQEPNLRSILEELFRKEK